MAVTAQGLGRQLGESGWTLERTKVNAASGWNRWCVRNAATGEVARFSLLQQVDVFWEGCVRTHLATVARADALAHWYDEGTGGLGEAVVAWLASGSERLPDALRDPLQSIGVPALPADWRRDAAKIPFLRPPRMVNLRDQVRESLARRVRARLEGLAASDAGGARQRL